MKKETDTDNFSFEAMMTMNVAKVKKKKKVKNVVDESDTKCLQFSSKASSIRPTTSKVAVETEMTDREAAILASSRKKGGGSMMMSKKIKYVTKVYSLKEMALKMLVNHPQYLLTCMHDYFYSADVLMPALERLDEKMLNLVSPAFKLFNIFDFEKK